VKSNSYYLLLKFKETTPPLTWGMAYRIASDDRDEVTSHLNYREKDGYSVATVDVYADEHANVPLIQGAITYIATPCNSSYLGHAPITHLAQHIFKSRGPSGLNVEYVMELVVAMRQFERPLVECDPHLFALEQELCRLMVAAMRPHLGEECFHFRFLKMHYPHLLSRSREGDQ